MNELSIKATLAAVSNQRNNALNDLAVYVGKVAELEAGNEGFDKVIADRSMVIADLRKENAALDETIADQAETIEAFKAVVEAAEGKIEELEGKLIAGKGYSHPPSEVEG